MSVVDNLIERSTVRFTDRLQRAISRTADAEQVGDKVALGHNRKEIFPLLVGTTR
jgi:hypothetical protein